MSPSDPSVNSNRYAKYFLLSIMAVQALLCLRLIHANSAFGDEALYLWSGHLEVAHLLHGAPVPAFQTWFSGSPVLYPVAAAAADHIGGLTGARLLSLVCMLGSTGCLYGMARRLADRTTALYGCAVFALLGPGWDLGVFATYDAPAILVLALAGYIATLQPRAIEPALLLVAALLALADAVKYAAALWNPVVIALVAVAALGHGGRVALLRAARTALYTAALITWAVVGLGGRPYERGISSTTTARIGGSNSVSMVLGQAATMIGPVLVLALLAVVIAANQERRMLPLMLVATAALLLAPANQARLGTTTSLHKHVVFGALFAAIAAGYALAYLHRAAAARATRVLMGATAFVPVVIIGLALSSNLYSYWPDSAGYVAALRPIMANRSMPRDYSLDGQGYDVVAYYLPTEVNSKDFQYQYWTTAGFTTAIDHRALAAVLLDWAGLDGKQDQVNEQILANSRTYRLAYAGTWSDEGKTLPLQVWALAAGTGPAS